MSTLEELRVSRGLTQELVANHAGIAVSTYSQYENGYRTVSLRTDELIAELIDVT